MVTNLCPYILNEQWCPNPGQLNPYGYAYHFDIMGGAGVFGDNVVVEFEEVACPVEAGIKWDTCECHPKVRGKPLGTASIDEAAEAAAAAAANATAGAGGNVAAPAPAPAPAPVSSGAAPVNLPQSTPVASSSGAASSAAVSKPTGNSNTDSNTVPVLESFQTVARPVETS
jgi:hypothetical protein